MNLGAIGSGRNCPKWKYWIIAAVFASIAVLVIYGNNQ
jgi:hypothetical protein